MVCVESGQRAAFLMRGCVYYYCARPFVYELQAVADLEGASLLRPLKLERLFFKSHFASECLKIRLG